MKPSENLFDLIKSLNKNEKRYIKLNNLTKDAKYRILFDVIDGQKEYDEKAIKGKFKNEKFIKQLTFTKNYLYNSILNSLISYNRSNSIETQLTEFVIKLRILFNKELFQQYFKTLQRYKEKAQEYEKHYILLELIRLQRLILETKKFRTVDQAALYKEEKDILKRIENLGQYSSVFHKAQSLRRKVGVSGRAKSNKDANRILQNKLLSDTKYALSSQAKEYFYHIKQILYAVKGEPEMQYKAAKIRLDLIESNPKPFMDDIVDVRREALLTLAELSVELKKRKEYKSHIKKFYYQPSESGAQKTTPGIISNFIDLKYIVSSGEYNEDNNVCKRVENDLVTFAGKLDKDIEFECMFLVVKFYFYSKEFEKALERNNKLLSHPISKYREDIYSYSKLMNLLIHYELGNYELLEYLIDAIKKHLGNNKELYKTEMKVIEMIRKSILIKPDIDRKAKITEIERNIIELKKTQGATTFYYFDLLSWIEEKLPQLIQARYYNP